MSSTMTILKKEKIKNIWCVANTTAFVHHEYAKLSYDEQQLADKRFRGSYLPHHAETAFDWISINKFNILVELINGTFLDNIVVGLVDKNNPKVILPYKPEFSFTKLNTFDCEYILDYYRDSNCEETNELFKFKIDLTDIENRIEKIHIVNHDPRTGVINEEKDLCLCYINYDRKALSKIKLMYGV